MFCGSCLRDNALAGALLRAGQRVTLVPLFTPMRTESASPAIDDIYYGGVNVYLQHATRVFRHTPRLLDWVFDRPGLLRLAGRFGTQTSPSRLGSLTLDILRGEDGPAVKELRRLLAFLKDLRLDVISLPNLMFIGMARLLRRELGVPIVCELTGEDLFLGQMLEPFRAKAAALIRDRAQDVTTFVATSAYYADEMASYLDIPRTRIEVAYPGVPADYLVSSIAARPNDRPPTVGFLARICPEKGFGQLLGAFALLREKPGMGDARLIAGGYLGGRDRKWFDDAMRRATASLPPGTIQYRGEVDRQGKLDLLDSVDVVCVPAVHPEPKGIYVLEALARGVPLVLPAHGSFPELIELSGGGVLAAPDDAAALATALAELLTDPPRRAALGIAGRDAVRNKFTEDLMGANMLDLYRRTVAGRQPSEPRAVAMAGEPR